MGEEITIGEIEVRERRIEVKVRTYSSRTSASAQFLADVDGKRVSSATLDGLREEIVKETRRQSVKVSVPFCRVTTASVYGQPRKERVQSGLITGKHAGTGNLLVRWDDGKPEQLTRGGELYRPLSPDEQEQLLTLRVRERAATQALREYTGERLLDASKAVELAISEAAAKEDES